MFKRLVERGFLAGSELEAVMAESASFSSYPEDILLSRGIPKHEILSSLSGYYDCPFVEYEENVIASYFLTMRLDMEKLKNALWFPLAVRQGRAEVIAYQPAAPAVIADIKATLNVERVDFLVALPADLIRIIEHNFDVSPHFPPSAGRTPLARTRTFLADRRSLFACYRTSLGKGRTGLAFFRTGISFISIAAVLFRIFGMGLSALPVALLFAAGVVMVIDGLVWYMPARKNGRKRLDCFSTEPTWGTTALEVVEPGNEPRFVRSGPVEVAAALRDGWRRLSPVMRRRFLAGDRTDFAEERTVLACYRTKMAMARTGLAFTRTGVSFAGLGIAFLRQFPVGVWSFFDAALIATGILMSVEGFYWYMPGRRAGEQGLASIRKKENSRSIWDFVFPQKTGLSATLPLRSSYVKPSYEPGIWATTGVALERTVLADRRNVMARLRTAMARSRTGLAFIRTGMSIAAVGMGLMVYFGTALIGWVVLNAVLIIFGLALIADGIYWHVPAERVRRQFPYCFGEMEIVLPDYGEPARFWEKVVFSNDSVE
jgi:uncharacterized membrane protein YidH (DUF202 family)